LDYSKMIVARMFNLPFVNFQWFLCQLLRNLSGNLNLGLDTLIYLLMSSEKGRDLHAMENSLRAPFKSFLDLGWMPRLDQQISQDFDFDPEIHHDSEAFWSFACDGELSKLLHLELFLIKSGYPHISIPFIVAILEPLQPFSTLKIVNGRWNPCNYKVHLWIWSDRQVCQSIEC
jgi:hypothetical protein